MKKSKQTLFGKTGMIKAKTGTADELASILLQAADLISHLKGNRLYAVGNDITNKNIIWVTEIWDSKDDHAASLTLAGVRELISKAMPLIDGVPEGGADLDILGGTGF